MKKVCMIVPNEPLIEVMRFSGTWKDLGTWNTLTEAMDSNNVGEALFNEKCENVHVVNELNMPVLCMGLKDVVVSASPEGILVSDKEQSSYIKPFVETFNKQVMFAEKSWGSFRVLDKDGVNAAFLICEMFTYYASQGIGLFEKLNELYAEYGYCLNTLHSYTFEGSAGFEKMQNIMVSFRKSITEFAGKKVLKCLDYSEGIDGLPKSDVLKFFLEDNCSIVVRPSGTEPKLKAYISVSATTKEEAQVVEGKLARAVEEKM